MVDNFEQLNSLLKFESDDDFYMLQIIKRRKENPDVDRNSSTLKTVYLHRENQLMEIKEDLIWLADKNNARIYLNPNRKSFKKCTCQCLKEFANRISEDNYHKPYKIFDSVAGSCGSKNPIWLIDIDWNDISEIFNNIDNIQYLKKTYINKICELINTLRPEGNDKVIAQIPTKNGVHILTKPFDVQEFRKWYPTTDIHKNNPTLVWCN